MSAGATSPQARTAESPPPATLQELAGQIAAQIQAAPAAEKSWKIAGFNIANLWAIVLLLISYVAPKVDSYLQKVDAALVAIPQIQAAADKMAESSKLTAALLAEMRADDQRRDDKLDALLHADHAALPPPSKALP